MKSSKSQLPCLSKRVVCSCEFPAFDYSVQSQVSLADLREFLSALNGTTVRINHDNVKRLSQLCQEFGFDGLAPLFVEYWSSERFREEAAMEDLEKRMRLSALEERMQQDDVDIATLQAELSRQSLAQESAEQWFRAQTESIARQANDTQNDIERLRREVEVLRDQVRTMSAFAENGTWIGAGRAKNEGQCAEKC
jgi:hypothetical protein